MHFVVCKYIYIQYLLGPEGVADTNKLMDKATHGRKCEEDACQNTLGWDGCIMYTKTGIRYQYTRSPFFLHIISSIYIVHVKS